MPDILPQNLLAVANRAYRSGQSAAAMTGYASALLQMPELGQTITANMARTRQQYLATSASTAKPKVVVCSWELAHNAAGRAHTLAQICAEFADVEIIGSIFTRWGRDLWEPLRGTQIGVDAFVVDSDRFLDQALALVAAHPTSICVLSKPRAPNVLFGILYKLLWGALVIVDIDDEELAFVHAQTPLLLTDYIQQRSAPPLLHKLADTDWTRLAVGLAQEFDAITVSNAALQGRYGGEIIGHARDPRALSPSADLRQASRQALGIASEQKVVLFSGTPRPHKGLLEVAHAIQDLGRTDILFVVAGSFASSEQALKSQLQEVTGVRYLFLENQPLSALAATLAIADCCVLLQSADHPFSPYQIPAKLSDALAMRIPVIATATPALADAIAAGIVTSATKDTLTAQLACVLDHPNQVQIASGQRYFLEHLSVAANATRLHRLITETCSSPLSAPLRQLLQSLSGFTPAMGYLPALGHVRFRDVFDQLQRQNRGSESTGKFAIAIHIYYSEIWPEIARYLKALHGPFIVDITTPPELVPHIEPVVRQDFPLARIHPTPNRGMDILPFLSLVALWQDDGIDTVCKIHTKRSDGGEIPTNWRKYLLDTLIGDQSIVNKITQAFAEHPRLSFAGPATLYLSGQRLMYANEPSLVRLNEALHQTPLPRTDWGFFAGTMFWVRPAVLAPLARIAASMATSADEAYARDGQFVNALERVFGLIPLHQRAQIGLIHPPTPTAAPTAAIASLEIVEALAATTPQLINPSHTTQAVRQTFSLVDWGAEDRKHRLAHLISIIIPIYNQPELTAACVTSIYEHTPIQEFELVLVDNGSDIATQAILNNFASTRPNLRLLRNSENLNFTHGCNLGFAASRGAIVVFLNNDTTVTRNWLPPLVEALELPDVTAVQPRLLYPDGTIQCIGVAFSNQSSLGYPIYAGRRPDGPWAKRSRAFQAITGACMALRASDFAEMRGFDPIYVNGQEDIDLCLRLNQRHNRSGGWVAANSTVIHHECKTPNRTHHISYNRRTFVRRWSSRIAPDDESYYLMDGFSILGYQSDSPLKNPPELQVFRANIRPLDPGPTQSTQVVL